MLIFLNMCEFLMQIINNELLLIASWNIFSSIIIKHIEVSVKHLSVLLPFLHISLAIEDRRTIFYHAYLTGLIILWHAFWIIFIILCRDFSRGWFFVSCKLSIKNEAILKNKFLYFWNIIVLTWTLFVF